MASDNRNYFLNLFHIVCVLTTIGFVGWCINEYSMDHDYTETTFASFQATPEDIYPSITICDMDPFVEDKYEEQLRSIPNIGNFFEASKTLNDVFGIHQSKALFSYKLFLNGANESLIAQDDFLRVLNITYDKYLYSLQQIDYDESTANLINLLNEFYITFPISADHHKLLNYHVKKGTLVANKNDLESMKESKHWEEDSIQGLKDIKTYVSFREAYRKCTTIDIPMAMGMDMREVGMQFNSSSFPSKKISPGKFFFYLTYPKQFLRSPFGSGIKLAIDMSVGCYKFELHVGYIRVVRRRDKKKVPCNPDWKHHDEKQMSHVSRTVGCIPKHWKLPSELPHCVVPQEFSEIKKKLNKKNGYMPPCRSIETLLKTTKGKTDWRMCLKNSFLDLKVFLDEQSHYEEVFLYPSYSLQNLVGNSGKLWLTNPRHFMLIHSYEYHEFYS